MADGRKKEERFCMILDVPASVKKGNEISGFFCDRIKEVSDVRFNYGWDGGVCRVILSGAADSVAHIMKAYFDAEFDD